MSINQKLADQVDLIEQQGELISKLGNYMQPFLINETTGKNDCKDKNIKSSESQMANMLQRSNDAIKENNRRITLLIELMDLDGD